MSSKNRTAAAKEVAKPALLPKLRFPKFRGVALRSMQLGGVTEEGRRRNGKKHSVAAVMGVTKADGIVPMEARLIAADIERYKLVEHDWFAYNPMRLNIGSIARWRGESEILVSPDYVVFKCITDDELGIAPGYLDHFRQTKAWKDFVTEGGDGGVRVRIYYKDIARLQLALPSLPEQQKIAECLSSVDELMAAQAQKVDGLKTRKKALMQQLFPREGETQPRLRFPEFQSAGGWEATTIGELKPFVTSGSRGWAAFYAEKGDLFVRITNLWRDSIYLDLTDTKFVQLPPGANEGVRTRLKKHDVLISITADIGIIGYVDESVPSPSYINQHVALVRFDVGRLCGKFVAYFLASDDSQRRFRASTDNGAKAGMSLIGIHKIQLMLPRLVEQERIASCLSHLDALITVETQKLEALKAHKKGLMQQLFPSAVEPAA